MEAVLLKLVLLMCFMIIMTVVLCCFSSQCGLPSLDECKALAEAAMCEGDLFSAVKFHLLSSEPENALQIGIDYVKGLNSSVSLCVRVWLPCSLQSHFKHDKCHNFQMTFK